ncbi:MAG: AAA family ATPase [Thermodesulfobacteriota bacterium]
MNYLKSLNLIREPFSNTPDPDFFFQSSQHLACLQKLEISVRLRRGLCVIIGDVGSGKTTLCRQLLRRLAQDQDVQTHLILDPSFDRPFDFLIKVAEMFEGRKPESGSGDWQIKEDIKQFLFHQGVENGKTVALIIDEGQKLSDYCLETLREFLNYETNDYKLLQIIIFAQQEFERTLNRMPNLADRINLFFPLSPLSLGETRGLIRFRLGQARGEPNPPEIFTWWAYWAIFRATGGYPRKIINLCHLCVLTLIVENRMKVDWLLVRSCARGAATLVQSKRRRTMVMAGLGVLILGLLVLSGGPMVLMAWKTEEPLTLFHRATKILPRSAETGPAAGPVERQSAREALPRPGPAGDSTVPIPAAPRQEPVQPTAAAESTPSYPPDRLGTITVQPGDTLASMIRKVYGRYDQFYLNKVREANPDLKNIEKILVGQRIDFPAVTRKVDLKPGQNWWVTMGPRDSLEDAVQFLRTAPDNLRIITYWNRREGLKFMIIVRDFYPNEALALTQIKQLPPPLAARARVTAAWPEDSVFYADPQSRGT